MSKEEEFTNYFGAVLDRVIEENLPHKVSEVMCVNCKKRWISVRPEMTLLKELECPQCHQQGYAIETGADISYGNNTGI